MLSRKRLEQKRIFAVPRPIVIVHHLMWTAYGFWLPNDPRGSTSRTIASDLIAELGELHHGRRKVQPSSHTIGEFRERAREVLKFRMLKITLQEFPIVAEGLAEAITEHRYTCYACAVMPDHLHVLIRKHKHQAEEMIDNLQHASRLRLSNSGHRESNHPVWAQGGCKVFIDHPDTVRRTIRYIEENPVKWKLPPQHWPFVREYDGWPLHPGHNPKSPYARLLREHGGC